MADNNSEVIIEYPSFETADKGIWIQVFSIVCLTVTFNIWPAVLDYKWDFKWETAEAMLTFWDLEGRVVIGVCLQITKLW